MYKRHKKKLKKKVRNGEYYACWFSHWKLFLKSLKIYCWTLIIKYFTFHISISTFHKMQDAMMNTNIINLQINLHFLYIKS